MATQRAVIERECRLVEGYHRLRKGCSLMKDGGHHLEGEPWQTAGQIVRRRKNGWEMRVYEIEGEIEVCLIAPDGTSKTYA